MIRNIAPETLETFLTAAATQLQLVRTNLQTFYKDESNTDVLLEVRRAIHRIKGEASIIGLSDFSHAAAFQEELVEELRLGTPPTPAAIQLLQQFTDALEAFLLDLGKEAVDEQQQLSDVILAHRRFRGLPSEEDTSELQRLMGWQQPELTPILDAAGNPIDLVQLESFRLEAVDYLQVMSDLLAVDRKLESEELKGIRHTLHSIKGGASAIGLQDPADLAHALEDLVDHIDQQDGELGGGSRTALVGAVEVLGDLVEEGRTNTDLDELIHQLEFISGSQESTAYAKPAQTTGSGNRANSPALPAADSSKLAVVDDTEQAKRELKADLENEVPEELYEIYREEAEDHIKLIYSGLNALKTTPDDQEQLQSVRRSAHTLKGASGAVGVRVVTKLSHRMEDLLDWLYDSKEPLTPDRLTLLLDTTDRLYDLSFGEFDKDEIANSIVNIYGQYDVHLGAIDQPSQDTAATGQLGINRDTASAPAASTHLVPAPAQQIASNVEQQAEKKPAKKQSADQRQMLRVPLRRIDDLVRTVSELIINRTTFEQRMADFVDGVDELSAIMNRLRNVATEMETRYSVNALDGNLGLAPTAASLPHPTRSQPHTSESRMEEFDSLEFDRYNEFHLLARSVGEVSNDVNTVTNELHTLIGDFDSLLARQDRLSRDTQDRLMKVRMVPLVTLATRLHRAVRVVASNQGKQVELVIDGEETEIDKTVLEEIADPLLHLMRNAVDHGVEPTELRIVKGKPELATIRLKAFYQGTQVVIRISDDGGGLDPSRIAEAAVRKGFLNKADVADMTPQEIFPYIFIPGLSTAAKLSEVSGRGVGMDIVRDKVQKLKGTISVDSEPDQGTTFTIRLPLTLAVTRALMVTAGNELFAIPMQSVIQIARLDRAAVEQLGTQPIVRLNGSAYPLVRLADKLALREVDSDSPTIPVLIVRSGDRELAVRVEGIVAGRDIVVKTLGSHLGKVEGLIGATLLGDGTVVPILDPNSLTGDNANASTSHTNRAVLTNQGETNVMLVDDSVSVRRVMENLVKAQGWTSMVGKDGVDALEVLQAADRIPDIFLLDVEMPRMDGFELLSTLRGMEETKDIPVVMVTSRSGEKHRQKAYSLGATDYMVKPYQDEQLVALIQQLTAKREPSLA